MPEEYQHLGIYSDWVEEAHHQYPLYATAYPGEETQRLVLETLGFCNGPEQPIDVRIEMRWQKEGIDGELVSWWVGYGPRTQAYVLKPSGCTRPLPGMLAFHDHGGFKYYGKEKIAEGPEETPAFIKKLFQQHYSGRALANELARQGYIVLVPDVFLWGSRKFPFETLPDEVRDAARRSLKTTQPDPDLPVEIALYNEASHDHEHWVAKYCNVLGTSLAGVISHEDRIAFNYLLSRPELVSAQAGCIGFSGGGNRAALLQATHPGVKATVIVSLMSTYKGLLDRNISHTWMLYPFNWSRHGDWPDLVACRAPSPLLVQYNLEDNLFTLQGMEAAHARLGMLYEAAGSRDTYFGQFYPGPHKFDLAMQSAAFLWLKKWFELISNK